jgi:hypothetical protein
MRTPCWLLALAFALGLGVLTPAADPPKADAEQIAKLVKQLGSDEFESREKATRELEAIGAPALEALRDAAKTGDAEVKTRATSILEKVEKKASAEKVLAPTKVKLAFKDTPVADAVAEFNKKSGYTIQLHDPEKKLKDRTVTLDTGEVTFWEAFDKFCEKAGLVEATWQDVMKPIAVPPRGGPGGGILPPPPPIVVPKDPGIKGDPLAPAKDEPEPKKDDGDKSDPPPVAVKPVAPVAPLPPPAGGFAGPAVRVAPGFGGMIGMNPAVITVVDGKPKTVPTCYSGAVRIRALKDAPNLGIPVPSPGAKDDTHQLWLEVRAEPKLQLLNIQSVAVEKATDDRDQKLEKVTAPAPDAPDAPPGVVPGRLPRRALPPAPAVGYIGGLGGFGGTQYFQVPLKKGEKEAKALKEFAGTISANLMAPAEAVITAEKITKAAGETFKGKDGGHIKVTEVKEEDGKITIKFELETPQNAAGAGLGGIGIAIPGGPVPVAPPPPPAPIPPAPAPALPPGGAGFAFEAEEPPAPPAPAAQIQIQIAPAVPPGGGLAAPRPGYFPAQGIALVDDKGKTIAQTGGAPPKFEFVPGGTPKVEYTQEYKLEKDQKPAKLVFSSSKMVTLDIPFSFKDVPLK